MPALQKRASSDNDPFAQQRDWGGAPGAEEDDGRVSGEARAGLFRALVVEDDLALLTLYHDVLREENIPVEQSANGHDALEKLSTTTYDLVITDINLPGLDGISLLQWIQRHRPETQVVVISGDGSADKILAAMRGGAKDYLVKPFGLPEFREMLNRRNLSPRPLDKEVFLSFLKQLLHDVRSEVVGLEAMAEQLQLGQFGTMDTGVGAQLLVMQEKIAQLKGVTADYCILGRNLMQSGGDIPTERVELNGDVIVQVLGEMQEGLQRKKIRVSYSKDLSFDGDACVMGNRVMLKSVFRTLFSSAITYSKDSGALSYGISTNGRRYKVYVANEGEILPAQLQAAIFDEFVQLRRTDGSSCLKEGLCLGLGLAKDILRQHGGNIWHESFVNGSKFVLTLPCCPMQPKE